MMDMEVIQLQQSLKGLFSVDMMATCCAAILQFHAMRAYNVKA